MLLIDSSVTVRWLGDREFNETQVYDRPNIHCSEHHQLLAGKLPGWLMTCSQSSLDSVITDTALEQEGEDH